MKDIRMIADEDVPCWYELSWDKEQIGIILRIYQDIVKSERCMVEKHPHLDQVLEVHPGLGEFQPSYNDDFGFEGRLLRLGERDGFVEFFIKIPAVSISLGVSCKSCSGTGKDLHHLDMDCHACDGTGIESKYDWREAFQITSSLAILFQHIRYPGFETTCLLPQLMLVATMSRVNAGMHACGIGGEYSLALMRYLSEIPENHRLPYVEEAMTKAWDRMLTIRDELYCNRMHAYIQTSPGGFTIDVPGNACGIYPSSSANFKRGEQLSGYDFTCHNTDTPAQQLTMLAGLAALHDGARLYLSKKT